MLKSPWELILTEPVPEVVEFRSADWAEKYFSAQSARSSSRVTLSPSYIQRNGKVVVENFRKKYSTKPRKSQALTWGIGTNTLPSIFSADLWKVYRKFFYYINTSEIPSELSRENFISSHVKITCYLHT